MWSDALGGDRDQQPSIFLSLIFADQMPALRLRKNNNIDTAAALDDDVFGATNDDDSIFWLLLCLWLRARRENMYMRIRVGEMYWERTVRVKKKEADVVS